MSRIQQCFDQFGCGPDQTNRPALVCFITAGDPDLETSQAIFESLPKAGADIVELGMPFSDPMAEGVPIQLASQRALNGGQTMQKTLDMVRRFRARNDTTPLILMGYYNPIYTYGVEPFLAHAKQAGIDGLIIVDLPPEADDELCLPAALHGINFIRLATPTTDEKRLPKVLHNSSGFIYYVSITGVTGAATPRADLVKQAVNRIKASTDLPVCVGFGVKDAATAQHIGQHADGVVVGSVLVEAIRTSLDKDGKATQETVHKVQNLVKELATGAHHAR